MVGLSLRMVSIMAENQKPMKKYKKYPLMKSHIDYGFIEPIKYFTPSIAISEITSISDDKDYVVSSMKEKSLFFSHLMIKTKFKN